MVASAAPSTKPTSYLGRLATAWNRNGLIGLDIGSHTVKVAQLERTDGRVCWRSMHAFAWEPVADAASKCGPFVSLRHPLQSLRGLFRGRDVACVLSMSLTQLRSLELAGDDPLQRAAAFDREFDNAPDDPCCTAYWSAPGPSLDETMWHTAIAVPERLTWQLGQTLFRAGWECVVLDALPCVLARLPVLAALPADDRVAIFDLGYENSTLVIAAEGHPLLSRRLRGINLQGLLQRLGDSLGLSEDESRQLLMRYGIRPHGQQPHAGRITAANRQILGGSLQIIVRELRRTLAYADQQGGLHLKPSALVLAGAGGLIQGLAAYLSEELALATQTWSLPAPTPFEVPEHTTQDAMFASAAVLSALAWEATDVR